MKTKNDSWWLGKMKVMSVLAFLPLTSAYALEGMDDSSLSDTAAQDGLTLRMILPDFDGAGAGTDLGIKAKQVIFHDKTGYGALSTPGAIVHGLGVAGNQLELTMAARSAINVTLDMVGDASATAGSQPMLNVRLDMPAFTLKTGKTYVARSNGMSAAVSSMSGVITDGMTLNVGAFTANMQLGYEAQGSMISLTGTMANGISATGYALYDANSGGSLQLPTIAVDNNGASTNLDMNIGIDVGTSGLLVHVIQLGSASGGIDLTLKDVAIGSAGAPKMGNFNIVGLNLATAWVRIDGHL